MGQAYRKSKYALEEKKKKRKKLLIIWSSAVAAAAICIAVLCVVIGNIGKISEDKYPVAQMEIEGYGVVEILLYPNDAPNTVRNFIELANSGFYNGQTISRVCDDFCIQMGSPDGSTSGGPGYSIQGEFASNGFNGNSLKHKAGTISMARTSDYNGAGSQFFICSDSNSSVSSLDGDYAAFGEVISGLDIIVRISELAHDSSMGSAGGGKPLQTVEVKSITVDTKGVEYKPADKISE